MKTRCPVVSAVLRSLLALLVALLLPVALTAQEGEGRVHVRVVSEAGPVPGAEVRSPASPDGTADALGQATLRLPAGEHRISVRKAGLAPGEVTVRVRAESDTTVTVRLEWIAVEAEGVVVTATRTSRRIEDEPERVEVLPREEIEEKLSMRPSDISMMLNETSGMRVQSTSSTLGGVSARIHGLRGRYTQILSDGLPLYGTTGAFGLLQIPPLDLAQVEVIKGGVSALYGASALGGVVNLVSRRPDGESELLANATSRGGTDLVGYGSGEVGGHWGYTVLAGLHGQREADFDGDGWTNLPGYRRAQVRPRFFWNDDRGRSLFVTVGGTVEERQGGTVSGAVTPGGSPFRESVGTRRGDAGFVGQWLLAGTRLLNVRGSATLQRHQHGYATRQEDDAHGTQFLEGTLRGESGPHVWVVGAALTRERYRAEDVSGFDYAYTTPGLFLIDDFAPARWLAVSASGRLERHSAFGPQFSPRVSVLLRPGGDLQARLSAGTGYSAPTPFVDETEEIGLAGVQPLQGLRVERARSASLDLTRELGPVELNATLFGSVVEHPLQLRGGEDGAPFRIVNAASPTRTWGTELYAVFRREPLVFIATHTWLQSTEPDPDNGARREVPLTPRRALSFDGMYENEEWGRVSVEVYYIGRQQLDDNPYRSQSRPYLILGTLAERRLGRVRLFVNAENLLDVRQTRFDPLLRDAPDRFGRWTVEEWAPLEGRVLNAGIRWGL